MQVYPLSFYLVSLTGLFVLVRSVSSECRVVRCLFVSTFLLKLFIQFRLNFSLNIFLKLEEYCRLGYDTLQSVSSFPLFRCGLDGPEIESQWGRDFPHPSRPSLGPTQPPIQGIPGLFPRVKRPGRGVNHPPPLVPRLNEE
jgi:hypothetical protein